MKNRKCILLTDNLKFLGAILKQDKIKNKVAHKNLWIDWIVKCNIFCAMQSVENIMVDNMGLKKHES